MEYPKPDFKKQKKAQNNKRILEPRRCALCHRVLLCETHEVFGGVNRQNSIEYGFQVPLDSRCHDLVTRNSESTLEAQQNWRTCYQELQEETWQSEGKTPEEARAMWIELMGRNYL